MTAPATPALGVASEVGTLHSVMVHRPDLAHERLSPSNCRELLFDDVIWTRRARQEFDAFHRIESEVEFQVGVRCDRRLVREAASARAADA